MEVIHALEIWEKKKKIFKFIIAAETEGTKYQHSSRFIFAHPVSNTVNGEVEKVLDNCNLFSYYPLLTLVP